MAQKEKTGEITLLLADRIPLFSSGLQHMLMSGKGFSRVDVTDNRKEVLQYLQAYRYDILMLDTRLNDSESIEILQHIIRFYPNQKIIFMGRLRDNRYLRDCIQNGLKGFVLRSSSLNEVLLAIRIVYQGGEYFSPEVARVIYKIVANPVAAEDGYTHMLMSRELQVLRRICDEKCNDQIASELNISLSMVKKYRSSLLKKTNSKNTVGLIRYAFQQGILKL